MSFETFVGHVGVDFLGNDRGGVSSELIKNNLHAMRGHVEGQKMRQADITDKQMQAAKHGHAQVIEQLRSTQTLTHKMLSLFCPHQTFSLVALQSSNFLRKPIQLTEKNLSKFL